MIMFGKSVEYFLDELDNNLDKYNDNIKNMLSSCEDYKIVKSLYESFENKEIGRLIIDSVLDEFNTARKNNDEHSWRMTYSHCLELYEECKYDFTLSLIKMMYNELYLREQSIISAANSQNKTYTEVLKTLIDKGC